MRGNQVKEGFAIQKDQRSITQHNTVQAIIENGDEVKQTWNTKPDFCTQRQVFIAKEGVKAGQTSSVAHTTPAHNRSEWQAKMVNKMVAGSRNSGRASYQDPVLQAAIDALLENARTSVLLLAALTTFARSKPPYPPKSLENLKDEVGTKGLRQVRNNATSADKGLINQLVAMWYADYGRRNTPCKKRKANKEAEGKKCGVSRIFLKKLH